MKLRYQYIYVCIFVNCAHTCVSFLVLTRNWSDLFSRRCRWFFFFLFLFLFCNLCSLFIICISQQMEWYECNWTATTTTEWFVDERCRMNSVTIFIKHLSAFGIPFRIIHEVLIEIAWNAHSICSLISLFLHTFSIKYYVEWCTPKIATGMMMMSMCVADALHFIVQLTPFTYLFEWMRSKKDAFLNWKEKHTLEMLLLFCVSTGFFLPVNANRASPNGTNHLLSLFLQLVSFHFFCAHLLIHR